MSERENSSQAVKLTILGEATSQPCPGLCEKQCPFRFIVRMGTGSLKYLRRDGWRALLRHIGNAAKSEATLARIESRRFEQTHRQACEPLKLTLIEQFA
ncbi:MAG TPA: hypothetical protein VNN73_18660 [Blastocatellia bacterium]|nr:hypothetical protein [Blastocatellia bacterium]